MVQLWWYQTPLAASLYIGVFTKAAGVWSRVLPTVWADGCSCDLCHSMPLQLAKSCKKNWQGRTGPWLFVILCMMLSPRGIFVAFPSIFPTCRSLSLWGCGTSSMAQPRHKVFAGNHPVPLRWGPAGLCHVFAYAWQNARLQSHESGQSSNIYTPAAALKKWSPSFSILSTLSQVRNDQRLWSLGPLVPHLGATVALVVGGPSAARTAERPRGCYAGAMGKHSCS